MTKIRKIKFAVLILIFTCVIVYINAKILSFDMRFYCGKDDGDFARLQSIIVMSTVFFFVMSQSYRFLNLILGFFLALFSSIVCYIASAFLPDFMGNPGVLFHILSCITFILLFFGVEKIQTRK